MSEPARRWPLVLRLGTAQTLAWASSYYLPAMLAPSMAQGLGLPASRVWLAFSLALVVSALLGPLAGRAIDRWGGRGVLSATSLVLAAGLLVLGLAQGPWTLHLGWVLIGAGMGAGLYEAAFATLVRLQGPAARTSITGITLIAGFASTVGWPLSAALEQALDWRGACLVWAALHLLVGLPLNAGLPRAPARPPVPAALDGGSASPEPPPPRTAWLLAYVFAATWFVSTAMAAHLPQLLMAGGATLAAAVALGALVGPAQVAGRLLEFGLMRRLHPLHSARLAAAAHPLGAALWVLAGPVTAPLFALLHGAGNGVMTIAKGTLPLALYGPLGYGRRQGWIVAPSRFAQAFAPVLFGLCLQRWGSGALWLTAGLGLSAFAALFALPSPRVRA